MLRSLGIATLVKWFVVSCVALAIWQGFDGNMGAIVNTLWEWVQTGADVVTRIWDSINSQQGAAKKHH